MKPVREAAAVYQREPCVRTFREDLEAHLLHGLVYSTSTCFVMARYVSRSWPDSTIVNPWLNDPTCSQLDTLHVYLAAGDLAELFDFPCQPVVWISFERRNILRYYSHISLKRRCTISKDHTTPLT